MKRRGKAALCLGMTGVMAVGTMLSGCGKEQTNGKVKIEVVQYKPEAVDVFEELEKKFNETHDNIELVIDSPNDAMTILKTRFIREDYPDIIGIGSDVNYSNFLDSDMLMDISDFDGLDDIKEAYLETDKEMEYVPMDGVYAMPYMANASGVLYNKDMFEEHGWTIPTTWDEFTALCERIEALPYSRGRLKIHICHPHRQFTFCHIPFQRSGISPVCDLIKIIVAHAVSSSLFFAVCPMPRLLFPVQKSSSLTDLPYLFPPSVL